MAWTVSRRGSRSSVKSGGSDAGSPTENESSWLQSLEIHGVSAYLSARNRTSRIVWMMVMICFIVLLAWSLGNTFLDYRDRPPATAIKFEFLARMKMPALYICPSKPLKKARAVNAQPVPSSENKNLAVSNNTTPTLEEQNRLGNDRQASSVLAPEWDSLETVASNKSAPAQQSENSSNDSMSTPDVSSTAPATASPDFGQTPAYVIIAAAPPLMMAPPPPPSGSSGGGGEDSQSSDAPSSTGAFSTPSPTTTPSAVEDDYDELDGFGDSLGMPVQLGDAPRYPDPPPVPVMNVSLGNREVFIGGGGSGGGGSQSKESPTVALTTAAPVYGIADVVHEIAPPPPPPSGGGGEGSQSDASPTTGAASTTSPATTTTTLSPTTTPSADEDEYDELGGFGDSLGMPVPMGNDLYYPSGGENGDTQSSSTSNASPTPEAASTASPSPTTSTRSSTTTATTLAPTTTPPATTTTTVPPATEPPVYEDEYDDLGGFGDSLGMEVPMGGDVILTGGGGGGGGGGKKPKRRKRLAPAPSEMSSVNEIFEACSLGGNEMSCNSFISEVVDPSRQICYGIEGGLSQAKLGSGLRLQMRVPPGGVYHGFYLRISEFLQPALPGKLLIPGGHKVELSLTTTEYTLIETRNSTCQEKTAEMKVLGTPYMAYTCALDCYLQQIHNHCGCVITIDDRFLASADTPRCKTAEQRQCQRNASKMLSYGNENEAAKTYGQCVEKCSLPCHTKR